MLGMTVAQMLGGMDALELAEWRAYLTLEAKAEGQRELASTAAAKLAARRQ